MKECQKEINAIEQRVHRLHKQLETSEDRNHYLEKKNSETMAETFLVDVEEIRLLLFHN